uniref:Amine oxidase n=1 Tax=Mesocestoides corti TaxID=53468 RepID=A0A5K3EUD5_MESCO
GNVIGLGLIPLPPLGSRPHAGAHNNCINFKTLAINEGIYPMTGAIPVQNVLLLGAHRQPEGLPRLETTIISTAESSGLESQWEGYQR